jgi:hypothetical protein
MSLNSALIVSNYIANIPCLTVESIISMNHEDKQNVIFCLNIIKDDLNKIDDSELRKVNINGIKIKTNLIRACKIGIAVISLSSQCGNNVEIAENVVTVFKNAIDMAKDVYEIIQQNQDFSNALPTNEEVAELTTWDKIKQYILSIDVTNPKLVCAVASIAIILVILIKKK